MFIKTNQNYDLNNFNLDIPVIRNEVKNQYPMASITCFYVKDASGGSTPCASLNGTSITPQGVLSLDTTYIENGNYAFTLEATYGNKKETEVFNVKVDNPNRAPVLASIGNKNVFEGELLEFSISATDPDGDAITYSHSCDGGCPPGLSFSGQDFSWTPVSAESGSYSVTFTATDDATSSLLTSETIIIQVTNVNHNPVLTAILDMTVAEDSLLTFSLSAADVDGDTLTYSCNLNCPTGMTLANNVVSWTPNFDQAGVYFVTFRAADDGSPSLADSKVAKITVTSTNRAPVLAAIGNKTVNENANLAFTISAIDPDVGDTVSYSHSCSVACPAGMSFVGNAFSWTPTYVQSGPYTVTFTATDNGIPVLTDTETITINVGNVNRPPNLANVPDQTVNENVAITPIDLNDLSDDFDVDGDVITYSCQYGMGIGSTSLGGAACTGVTGFNFDQDSGEITWTPDYTQAGSYEFKVTGSDDSLTSDRVFLIIVNNVNRAPVLTAIPDKTVAVETELSFTLAATDPDGDAIAYTCTLNCPVGLTLTGAVVTWTPDYSDAGEHLITFTATDDGVPNLTDTKVAKVTVTNTNRAPVLTAIPDKTVAEGIELSFTLAATDPDGDAIAYTCTLNCPVGLSITGAIVTWTPGFSDAGEHLITFTATDDGTPNLTNTKVAKVTVTNTNRAPVLTAIPDKTVAEETELSFTLAATDPDGDAIAYTCTLNCPAGLSITGAVVTWTPGFSDAGEHLITFTATDDGTPNLTNTKVAKVTVTNTNRAPNLAAVGNETVGENVAITLIDLNDLGDDEDADGDAITYSCIHDIGLGSTVTGGTDCSGLAGFNFASATGIITWTPDYTQAGVHEFKVTGTDPFGAAGDRVFLITVNNVNRPPVLAAIGNKTVDEDTQLTLTLSATDPDVGDTLTYSHTCAVACPAGMSWSANVFSWKPTFTQSGVHTITFTVTDDGTGSLTDTETITITVNDVSVAPDLAAIGNQVVDENTAIVSINANDGADDFDSIGDPITYTCYYDTTVDGSVATTNTCGSLSGATFTAATGVMTWTPKYGSYANYEFKIIGDNGSATDSVIFEILVNNSYPIILTFETTAASQQINLPTERGLGGYNYFVDWGDSSTNSYTGSTTKRLHIYASAGEYVVKIYGQFPSIITYTDGYNHNEFKARLKRVNDLGRTGLKNLNTAFANCTKLISFNVGFGDTSAVTNMTDMFENATGLTSLDLSDLDTSSVTSMQAMFYNTSGLTSINLTGFDTSKVTTMEYMFYNNVKLTSLDLSGFDTSAVETMEAMFLQNHLLTSLDISNFDTAKVTNMMSMFGEVASLEELDVSHFDTSKVTTMLSMFEENQSLISLDLSGFDTSLVMDFKYMFGNVRSMTTLNLNGWVVNPASVRTDAFYSPPAGATVYCNQVAVGDKFGIPCTVGP